MTRPANNTAPSPKPEARVDGVIYTGRVDDLGSEICIVKARSDWGDEGWMICEEIRIPGRDPFRTPKLFFCGKSLKDLEACILAARTEDFYGYPAPELD
jgi:hypothetical protein